MKIALACQSLLLEKSLKLFLKNFIYPYKQCDFVISDRHIEIDKPLFYIASENSDLNIPFSKSSLLLQIEKFHETLTKMNEEEQSLHVNKVDLKDLEQKITKLTDDFRDNLVHVIKDYYEN